MKKQGFISTDEVLAIHANLIRRYGGLSGVRDRGLLESALARPFQSFNGEDLYPSLEQKAAAILESIVKNHPFIDGNKRTGYVLMRLLLLEFQKDILASENEKYDFVIAIASGKADFKEILDWIRDKTPK
jgi:death on curing protein